MNNKTLSYYNENAKDFISGTINADVSDLYNMFLKYIPEKGHILDLGCGSGRDSKAFIDKGYNVTAIDGSKELCDLASEYINQEVINLTFDKIDYIDEFDGIWACASLLHLPHQEIENVFIKLAKAIKKGGYIYSSFKYGDFEGERNGRYFTNLTEKSLLDIINNVSDFTIVNTVITGDVRENRESEKWLNALIKKS